MEGNATEKSDNAQYANAVLDRDNPRRGVHVDHAVTRDPAVDKASLRYVGPRFKSGHKSAG